jgi:hypothetical protein
MLWRLLLTILYLHFPLSITRQRILCSSPTFEPWGPCLVKQFLRCPLSVHNHRPGSSFLLGRTFRKSKLFMDGIWTLAFEKQDWGTVSFLVCIVVLLFIIVLGIYFVFDFHCTYWSNGQFSWTMHIQIGKHLFSPTSISVCYIISLGECVFWLIRICSLVLKLWMCAYVVPKSTFKELKGYNLLHYI